MYFRSRIEIKSEICEMQRCSGFDMVLILMSGALVAKK